MRDTAIRAEGLSKQYYIGSQQKHYSRLGDRIIDSTLAPVRRVGKLLRGQASGVAELNERIWVLDDVSFEIRQGEVVGVIGHNGAGKSTLLKILSRITEPSKGFADIHGRVGSLLEVGTGFHPELTGRENIYLNGAILGMKKAEIKSKFDEIVDFAEIDRFVDTPVKHYSSGMYVRLAFSVAAHLETDILLVDEVLAVGDMAFQRKCLGKMENVAQHGRTVLFVSHNMGLMQTLCQRGILLNNGRIQIDTNIGDAVSAYLHSLEGTVAQELSERTDRKGRGLVRLIQVEVSNGTSITSPVLRAGEPARFVFRLNRIMAGISCVFSIFDHLGQHVAVFESSIPGQEDVQDPELGATFVCDLDALLLLPGRYRINVLIRDSGEKQDFVEAAAMFDVVGGLHNGRPLTARKRVNLYIPHRWMIPRDV